MNLPLPLATKWADYSRALETALDRLRNYSPDYVVVALGVDTYIGDPAGRLALDYDDFKRMGEAIGKVSSPHMFVLEGGYQLDAIGSCVSNVVSA